MSSSYAVESTVNIELNISSDTKLNAIKNAITFSLSDKNVDVKTINEISNKINQKLGDEINFTDKIIFSAEYVKKVNEWKNIKAVPQISVNRSLPCNKKFTIEADVNGKNVKFNLSCSNEYILTLASTSIVSQNHNNKSSTDKSNSVTIQTLVNVTYQFKANISSKIFNGGKIEVAGSALQPNPEVVSVILYEK